MGTTKENLQDFQKTFATWASTVQSHVGDAVKTLNKGAEVPADSPMWGQLKADANDPAFLKFLDMCGLTVAAGAAPPSDSTNIEFRDFLENMSQSMVQTQQQLDVASASYLAAAAEQPHVQPSVFRIPKLSAQMRFALEIQNGKTLNLLFFKQTEQTTSRNEQMIDFDIITAPAPPGATQAVAKLAPRMDLVLDPFERKRVINAIGSASPKEGTSPALLTPVVQAASDPISPDLVILSVESAEGDAEYLVFLATEDSDHSIGLWKLTIPDDGNAVLEVVQRFNRNNGPEEGVLQDVILAVAAKQKVYFTD